MSMCRCVFLLSENNMDMSKRIPALLIKGVKMYLLARGESTIKKDNSINIYSFLQWSQMHGFVRDIKVICI